MKRVACIVAAVMLMAGCRKAGKSLSLPATPSIPYLYSMADYNRDIATYNAFASLPDPASQQNARIARNSICWGLMGIMDELYSEYAANLFTGEGSLRVAGDASRIGLTAAGAIAHQVATKTLLGVLGVAVSGINLSVDKNVFAQKSYQVIAMSMETRRAQIYDAITRSLSAPVTDYPLSACRRDLVLYLYAGSLPGGLQEIQKEAAKAAVETHGSVRGVGAPRP